VKRPPRRTPVAALGEHPIPDTRTLDLITRRLQSNHSRMDEQAEFFAIDTGVILHAALTGP